MFIATKQDDQYVIKTIGTQTDVDGNEFTIYTDTLILAQSELDKYQAILDAVAQADQGVEEKTQLETAKTALQAQVKPEPVQIEEEEWF